MVCMAIVNKDLSVSATVTDRAYSTIVNEPKPGFLSNVATTVSQKLCALRGHDSVLHFEGNRVMMRCTSCRYDSPGWEVSGRRPRQRYEGDRRRHVLVPQRMILRPTK
jgi:hypothetical protein